MGNSYWYNINYRGRTNADIGVDISRFPSYGIYSRWHDRRSFAKMATSPGFAQLPDVVLLTVLKNLPTSDIVNIVQVDNRLKRLCTERSIVR